jgi:protein ImuA
MRLLDDSIKKSNVVIELQKSLLNMQGFRFSGNRLLDLELGPIIESFPSASFPLGTVHEFLSEQTEDSASTIGFIAVLISFLIGHSGATLWISSSRTIFPPALKTFGVEPDRFIFLDLKKEKDVIWAMEESLKCSALSAVVGEVGAIDFTSSRRLQLAVEQSKVTGFLLKNTYRQLNATACFSRWKISSLPSEKADFPGIGFPKWKVDLLRVRNGKPNSWSIQWVDGKFVHYNPEVSANTEHILHAV